PNIIFTKAHKGNITVALNRDDYIFYLYKHTSRQGNSDKEDKTASKSWFTIPYLPLISEKFKSITVNYRKLRTGTRSIMPPFANLDEDMISIDNCEKETLPIEFTSLFNCNEQFPKSVRSYCISNKHRPFLRNSFSGSIENWCDSSTLPQLTKLLKTLFLKAGPVWYSNYCWTTFKRWNSFYDAIVEVTDNTEQVNVLASSLKIPLLTPTEIDFLKEYCTVMMLLLFFKIYVYIRFLL
ncbi:hypothetical protein ALC57_12527, partial [Trachymyrmex cornetzi]